MASIRIFLLTCRRPQLLPRALASLRAQTFTDWVCELHNDAPEDHSPRDLLATLRDPRITLHQHSVNWGPVATFNHAFAAGPEPFASILEDDNWWEPEFLATAYAAILAAPRANVIWSNMRIWQEQSDGKWSDTGRTVWRTSPADSHPRLYHWPQPLQLDNALHSNGAMLYRSAASVAACVPPSTPFAIIEPVRERLLPGGWLFIPQVLANFAHTLSTARSDNRDHWAQAQLLVAASYLAASPVPPHEIAAHWNRLRRQRPRGTLFLFHLACAGIRPLSILSHAGMTDWLHFLASAFRHPLNLLRALRFRSIHPQVWPCLLAAAQARSRENHPGVDNPVLFEKTLVP